MSSIDTPTSPASQSILITGCSSGIGKHVALALHEKGYAVYATARNSEDVMALRSYGLQACELDLDSSESIQQAVTWVLEQTNGHLYALFNNGAYGQPGAVEDLSRDVLRQQFETNVLGWHELTNLVIPTMRKQGYGRIIHNSSVLGLVAMQYRGAYNASKFALEGLTDTLRQELDGSGVYISLIEPGPITSQFRVNAFAKFKANIKTQGSPHQTIYEQVEKRLASASDKDAPFTLGPEAVLQKVEHILTSKRPKIRYYVTFPTYLFGYLKRLLPARWLDLLLLAISRRENR